MSIMTDQEFQIAVIAIVFGSAIAVAFLVTIGTIINSWLKRKSRSGLTENEEFLEALRQFKQKTDKRLSHLEMIISDDEPDPMHKKTSNLSGSQQIIEIENKSKVDREEKKDQSGNLRNMLSE